MFGWFKKKEEISVKQKQTKISLVQLESKFETIDIIKGHYLITFLTYDDKTMQYTQEFIQDIPSINPSKSFLSRWGQELVTEQEVRVTYGYFSLVHKNGESERYDVDISERLIYNRYHYGNGYGVKPCEYIPCGQTVLIDGVLYNVKAYISNTFIETSREQREIELKQYTHKFEQELP